MLLTPQKIFFRWDGLFLAVPAGNVSRCFVNYSNNLPDSWVLHL